MSATTTVITTTAYVEVIDVLETTWVLQNTGTSAVEVVLSTLEPAASVRGHILDSMESMTSAIYGANNLFVRSRAPGIPVVITK